MICTHTACRGRVTSDLADPVSVRGLAGTRVVGIRYTSFLLCRVFAGEEGSPDAHEVPRHCPCDYRPV